MFRLACSQGIFEASNVRILQQLCRPGSHMFDVGANIGLMALPVLSSVSDATVVSFEPSPNTVPFLRRTIASSGLRERWLLVDKAVGRRPGAEQFSLSSRAEGVYDGLRHTNRTPQMRLPVELGDDGTEAVDEAIRGGGIVPRDLNPNLDGVQLRLIPAPGLPHVTPLPDGRPAGRVPAV